MLLPGSSEQTDDSVPTALDTPRKPTRPPPILVVQPDGVQVRAAS